MQSFDFEYYIDRRSSSSIKWSKYTNPDIIPMWLADMDFRSPPAVIEALQQRAEHGIFGYTHAPTALTETIINRLKNDYGWEIEAKWLVWLPGLVCGLNVVSRAIGEPGCDIMTPTPVYDPIFTCAEHAGKRALCISLARDGQRYTFDFDAMQAALTPQTRLFILCNPHNPVGRVWDEQELLALAEFCLRNNLVVCADEIHCQLILDQHKQHLPFAHLDQAIADRTITLMAPSKTYNLAGLGCAFAIIPNANIRAQIQTAARGIVPLVNVFGYTAALAAYRHGDAWLTELLNYLWSNYQLLQHTLAAVPELTLTPLEATYLAWIEVDQNISNPAKFFTQAGVGLAPGTQYQGEGFVRLNFACPRSLLQTALQRICRCLV